MKMYIQEVAEQDPATYRLVDMKPGETVTTTHVATGKFNTYGIFDSGIEHNDIPVYVMVPINN